MNRTSNTTRLIVGLLAAWPLLAAGCDSPARRDLRQFPPAPQYASDHQYTLNELVEMSIYHNPTLDAARYNVEAAEGLVDQVKALWLPQIRYNFAAAAYDNDLNYKVRAFGLATINVPVTGAYNINNTASLTQILTTSGKRTSGLKQVKMYSEIQRLQVLMLQDCLAFNVANFYYLVCLTNDVDAVLEDSLRRIRVFRQVARGLNERGSLRASSLDTLQADFLARQLEQLRIVAQAGRYQSYQALRTFVGAPHEQILMLREASLPPVLQGQQVLGRAATIALGFLRRPEIRQVDLLTHIFQEQVRFVKAGWMPDVAFAGIATDTAGNHNTILNAVKGLIGTVVVDVPIYDPAQRGRLRTALGLERASQAFQRQVDDLIGLEIDLTRTCTQQSLAMTLKSLQSKQIAADHYQAARQACSRELIPASDVVIAITLDMFAKLEYLQTLYAYHCAQARLKRVTADREILHVQQ